jgi:cytochrome c
MKRLRYFVIAILSALAASFLLGYIHPYGDAGLFGASPSDPLVEQSSVPLQVRAILVKKCADCHSNATRRPVYAHFAPGSWLIERDIAKGRAAMNLSQWQNDTPAQQAAFQAKIAHEVRKRDMPPVQYLAFHWNARLSNDDMRAIAAWAKPAASGDRPESTSLAAAGNPMRGKAIFESRCTGCHSLHQNLEGPHLGGVYGRTAGTVSGFDYSPALKSTHIVWSEETLNRWLTDPQTMVPGADMDFFVKDPQQRVDVIAFLKLQTAK